MLRLTHEPFDCFSSPVRIGIANDLNVEIPDGEGLIWERWERAADELLTTLRGLGETTQFLQYRWFDKDTISIRIHEDRYPATQVLTHPKLIKHLHSSTRGVYNCDVVIYVKGDKIRARPRSAASAMKDWKGPYVIDNGYCLDLAPQ